VTDEKKKRRIDGYVKYFERELEWFRQHWKEG